LNSMAAFAHTPVSMLGKIFNIIFLFTKSINETNDKSVLTKLKFGADLPMEGNVPIVLIELPLKVIVLILNLLINNRNNSI
jgi:hypothetical protein